VPCYGSGKGGHTSTRGNKGQLARSSVHQWFEGGQLPLTKRLPFQRGKARFKSIKKDPLIVKLKYLNVLPKNSQVNLKTLVKHGIIRSRESEIFGVKILGDGKLEKALTVSLPTSKAAAIAIKKAGGKVEVATKKPKPTPKPKKATKKKK